MEYAYKFIKGSTWGIWIAISAEITATEIPELVIDKPTFQGYPNQDGPTWLTDRQKEMLKLGFERAGKSVRVIVQNISYNVCDYQDEGMAPAMAGLIAKYYNCEPPKFSIHFDKTKRKYIFAGIND